MIHCAYDRIVGIDELVPNPRNPNTHPAEQIRLLAKIITQQGWRAPITVSNRSGYIVRGHGRLKAALMAGIEEVPVDFQDYNSDAEEYADLIADNQIAELAEIDRTTLKDLIEEIDTGEIDMELLGFSEYALKSLMSANADIELPSWDGMPEFGNDEISCYKTIKVHFNSEEALKDFSRLIGQEISDKVKYIYHPKLDTVKTTNMRVISES